jgi:hypothetical protein
MLALREQNDYHLRLGFRGTAEQLRTVLQAVLFTCAASASSSSFLAECGLARRQMADFVSPGLWKLRDEQYPLVQLDWRHYSCASLVCFRASLAATECDCVAEWRTRHSRRVALRRHRRA